MALTKAKIREILSEAGADESKISDATAKIMEGHTASIDALREERDNYKKEAEAAAENKKNAEDLQKEVDKLKESNKDSYKVKYDELKDEFAEYKKGVESEKTKASKAKAYKALLKEAEISEKVIDDILDITNFDKIKLDKDGNIEGADDIKKNVAEKYAGFRVKTEKKGAETSNPPGSTGGKALDKAEILKIKDTAKRQEAWGQYLAQQNGGN